MKLAIAFSVAVAAMTATAASAAPIVSLSQIAPTGTKSIQNFDSLTTGSSIGTNAFAFAGSDGNGAKPAQSTGNYGSVLGNGSYSVDFSATNAFSFLLGTLDGYNSLKLAFTDGTSTQYDGSAITNGLGGQGYVTYSTGTGPKIVGATFTSGSNSFEFDNLSAAVPEPATWAMMIVGFGLVGASMRRRSMTVRYA